MQSHTKTWRHLNKNTRRKKEGAAKNINNPDTISTDHPRSPPFPLSTHGGAPHAPLGTPASPRTAEGSPIPGHPFLRNAASGSRSIPRGTLDRSSRRRPAAVPTEEARGKHGVRVHGLVSTEEGGGGVTLVPGHLLSCLPQNSFYRGTARAQGRAVRTLSRPGRSVR